MGLNVEHYTSRVVTACLQGDLPRLKHIFAKGLTLADVIQHQDNVALLEACLGGYVHIIQFFVQCGLTLTDLRARHNEALFSACQRGHTLVLQYLATVGLTVEDAQDGQNRCLKWACLLGHLSTVQELLRWGLSLADLRHEDNYCLRWAARNGEYEIVQLLMSFGLTRHDLVADHHYILQWICHNYMASTEAHIKGPSYQTDIFKTSRIQPSPYRYVLLLQFLIEHVGYTPEHIRQWVSREYWGYLQHLLNFDRAASPLCSIM